MPTKTTFIVATILILAGTLIGLALWPRLPEQMASHWNMQNQVDGYMSRVWGVLMLPVMNVALLLLFLLLPNIDPLKENIAKFRETFNVFIVFLVAFMTYIYVLTLIFNLGYHFNMGTAMLPAMGAFIFYAGVLISKAKRNWFIGIRTPWTLSSEQVWAETHRTGAILFKVSGILTILGAFLGPYAFWFALVPLLGSSLFLMVYSYVLYQREAKAAKKL
jgi:uncharacterized membrane protein